MSPDIGLVCLDMAGTTVRDDGMVERAFETALEQVGVDDLGVALAFVRETMGRSKIEVCRELYAGDERKAVAANAAFERAYESACALGEAEPIPGAEDAIRSMRSGGALVCFMTGFSESTRDALLSALAWHDLVDLALSPGDAVRGRPAPDMILSAVMRLRIDDVGSVAVAGDTSSDLVAGTCAGASIVAGVLTGAHSRAELESAPHTHIISSIADLPRLLGRP